VLRSTPYDWLVVQGDTATAAAAAIAGFFNKVRVAHVEAGLRTGNLLSPWPEEFNRRAVTLCTSLHFAPTRAAARNLLGEGIEPDSIHVVGNTVVDALLHVRSLVAQGGYAPREPALRALPPDKKLVLVTTHRRENFGEPLRQILLALKELGRDGDKTVVLPVHLNPTVRAEVMRILDRAPGVILLEPLQYPDFVYLLERAWVVVTDSGGVQEEAPTFGLRVIIARDTTERPEVVDAGFGRLVGSSYEAIVSGVRTATMYAQRQVIAGANPFGEGDAGKKIASLLPGVRSSPRVHRPLEEAIST
jgi:UDP-N-acetylglucosamine 2-epimerase